MLRAPVQPAATLVGYRYGAGDPTTIHSPGEFWRATLTPDGPGTLHLDWRDGTLRAEAWGDGANWLLAGVPALVGEADPGHVFTDAHPAVLHAQRNHPDVRFGASRTLYHELLPTIIAQRITGGEAVRQWRQLVRQLGRPAPGPPAAAAGLMLPPTPQDLLSRPTWWFHPLGIEVKRAEALRTVARHADRLHAWVDEPDVATRLALLPGIGQWTIGSVLATAAGDPDAVAVGDFHLRNIVTHAFTGRPRGSDEDMLELLEPYAGQRGRVVRLLLLDGHRAPKFGPRQRILPLNRW
jgi:3-methyladenine DNA glycosylase/8-oxoguanine DNA glycosylase